MFQILCCIITYNFLLPYTYLPSTIQQNYEKETKSKKNMFQGYIYFFQVTENDSCDVTEVSAKKLPSIYKF